MDDFYAELKQRAERLGQDAFAAWLKGPVLLLELANEDEDEQSWIPGSATSIISNVALQSALEDPGSEREGKGDAIRTAYRLPATRGESETLSVGRSWDCDIVIDHPSISKVHAHIARMEDGTVQLIDTGSRNGSTVNGRRVTPGAPTRIRPDDVIRIGAAMARIAYPKQLHALLLGKAPPTSMLSPLRDRTFLALWAGAAFSFLADGLYRTALLTWIVTTTGSGAALSAVALCTIVPMVVTLLFGGSVVERISRSRVLLISLALRAIVVGGVAFALLHHQLVIWHLYLAGGLLGVGEGLLRPNVTALLPEIIRRDELTSANALLTISSQSALIFGPLLATLLLSLGGTSLAISFAAIAYLVGGLSMAQLRVASGELAGGKSGARGTSTREAFAILRGNPLLWLTSFSYALAGAIGFASSAVALPILIKTSIHVDIKYYGICQSMISVGALIASMWLGKRARVRRRGLTVHAMLALFGCCVLSASFPITIYGIAAAWLLCGLTLTVAGLIWIGTLQQTVPIEHLGRVASLDSFAQISATLLAFVTVGWLTEVLRPELVFVIGGVTVIVAAIAGLVNPKVRAFE